MIQVLQSKWGEGRKIGSESFLAFREQDAGDPVPQSRVQGEPCCFTVLGSGEVDAPEHAPAPCSRVGHV